MLINAHLKIWKVKVSPSISMAHEIALKKGPAVYPIRRLHEFHHPKGKFLPDKR